MPSPIHQNTIKPYPQLKEMTYCMNNKNLQRQLFDKLDGSRWAGDERYFSCWCVFDSHKKPALIVYGDGFYCLSCQKGGTLEYLLKSVSKGILHKSVSTPLKTILPKWSNWQRRYESIEGIAEAAHRIGKDFMGYFKKRQIDQFYEVGYFGRMDGWIVMPVFDRSHQIVDLVVRKTSGKGEETAKYVVAPTANEERPLYVPNWERVLASDKIYVVFGIITAWGMEAVGLPCITGITGKSLRPELLQDFQKQIIVIPDVDEDSAGARLVNGLGWRGKLKLINWPDDMTDLDDVRIKMGNQALIQMVGT